MMQHQTVAINQVTELNEVWVVRTVKSTNIKVSSDINGYLVGDELFKKNTQFVKEQLLHRHRTRSVNSSYDGSELSNDGVNTDQLERRQLVDCERLHDRVRYREYNDAAMVDRQIISGPWARSIYNIKTS